MFETTGDLLIVRWADVLNSIAADAPPQALLTFWQTNNDNARTPRGSRDDTLLIQSFVPPPPLAHRARPTHQAPRADPHFELITGIPDADSNDGRLITLRSDELSPDWQQFVFGLGPHARGLRSIGRTVWDADVIRGRTVEETIRDQLRQLDNQRRQGAPLTLFGIPM